MKKILVLDDDDAIQELFKMIFKSSYHVMVESDPGNILRGQYEMPDIFLLDRQLPGVDGLTVCKHLKNSSETSHIPVIMVSASPGIEALSKLAGADNFVEKPFDIIHLLEVIDTLLQKDPVA